MLGGSKAKVHFDRQEKGEEIVLLLRQHLITQIPTVIGILILAILPFVYLYFDLNYFHLLALLPTKTIIFIFILWSFVSIGFAFERFLFWYFNVYILTNERVVDIDFFGISAKRVSETRLSQIQDISSDMSGPLRVLFHFGDVVIQTAAEKPEFDFHAVPYCDLVAKKIGEECRKEEAEPPGVIA